MTDISCIDRSQLRACDKYCGKLYADEEGNINIDKCANCHERALLEYELAEMIGGEK